MLSPLAHLVTTARKQSTLLIAGQGAPTAQEKVLAAAGVEVLYVGRDAVGHVDLGAALKALAARGITRILSEGGPGIAARLIAENYADEVVLFTSRALLGHSGLAVLDKASRARLEDSDVYRIAEDGLLGADRRRQYQRIF